MSQKRLMRQKFAILFLILFISLSAFALALGEWKQYDKDEQLSQYQPYSILQSTAVTTYSIPLKPVNEMLVTLPSYSFDANKLKNYTQNQILVGEWAGERNIVVFAETSSKEMRLYRVVNKTFQLKDTEILPPYKLMASAIYDLDNDASDEIIIVQNNNVSIYGISAGSFALEKTFEIYLWNYFYPESNAGGNLVCSDMLGGTCFISNNYVAGLSAGNSGFLLFNYSGYNFLDNLKRQLGVGYLHYGQTTKPDTNLGVKTAIPVASIVDVMGDSKKEIIFTLYSAGSGNAFYEYEGMQYADDGQLIIISEESAMNCTLGTSYCKPAKVRNLTEFVGDYWFRRNFTASYLNANIFVYETITKADDMNKDNEKEIIITLNTWFGENINNVTSSSVANKMASRWLWLNNSDIDNLGYFYSKRFYNEMQGGKYCIFPIDVTLNDFETNDDSECNKNLIAVANQHQEVVSGSGSNCANYIDNFNLQIDEFFCFWGSHYFLLDDKGLSSGLKSVVLDNRQMFVGMKEGEYIYLDEMPNHGIIEREDAGVEVGLCSFTDINSDLTYKCPRYTFADVDKDGLIEAIVQNSTSLVLLYQTNYTPNQEPAISGFCYNTGEPICYNHNITYTVNYTDAENDEIAMRVDCRGFGNYTPWSSFSTNPSVTCQYDWLGNFNTEICITDILHYPTNADCEIHEVNVAYTNCYETGQNGDCEGIAETIEYNIFGIRRSQFNKTITYKSQYGFDWDRCSNWTFMHGFCPFWIWTLALLQITWDWIFANFWLFLIALLLIIIIAFIKRSMRH